MQISRISMITLGVADLAEATRFYREVLATSPNTASAGVTFIELPGIWLALYPLPDLTRDVAPAVPAVPGAFRGVTLAHNARSREDVTAVIERARAAGASAVRDPEDTFWGGFSGYFADPDGHFWEVAWGPMFDFAEDGALRFKP